jgi:hypothetical protein
MYALVESGTIKKFYSGNQGITIGDLQYSKQIFTVWSKDEREAIGIYEVEMDNSKRKDDYWYINTNVTYAFGSGKVTGSYGDATARAHADTKYTNQDKTDNKIPADKDVGDIKVKGLKTKLIEILKEQAAGILQETDWYVLRKADAATAIPSAITTHRAAVRTKCASMETSITNASDTAALETLYTYTEQEDGSITRPLGELPTLES